VIAVRRNRWRRQYEWPVTSTELLAWVESEPEWRHRPLTETDLIVWIRIREQAKLPLMLEELEAWLEHERSVARAEVREELEHDEAFLIAAGVLPPRRRSVKPIIDICPLPPADRARHEEEEWQEIEPVWSPDVLARAARRDKHERRLFEIFAAESERYKRAHTRKRLLDAVVGYGIAIVVVVVLAWWYT
jgi:hypothetical protein